MDNIPKPVVASTPNVVSLTLGIITVVIGVFALLSCWIPLLGLVVIPSAFIGFLLAIIGIVFAITKQRKSIELPILGGLLCVGAIIISLVSSALAAKAAAELIAKAQAIAEQQRQNELKQQQALVNLKAEQQKQDQENLLAQQKSRLASLRENLVRQQSDYDTAKTNRASVQAAYDKFMAEKPYLTNSVYLSLKVKLQTAIQQQANYAQSGDVAEQTLSKPSQVNAAYRKDVIAQQQQNVALSRQNIQSLSKTIQGLNYQIDDLISSVNGFQSSKLNEAIAQETRAKTALENTQSQIERLE